MPKREDFINKFQKILIERPKTMLLIVVIIAAICAPGLTKLGFLSGTKVWFQKDDPVLLEQQEFTKTFGSDDSIIVAIKNPAGVLNKETIELVQRISEELWLVKDVIRVESLTSYVWTEGLEDDIISRPLFPEEEELTDSFLLQRKNIISSRPGIKGRMISKDFDTALVYGFLKPSFGGEPPFFEIYEDLNLKLEKINIPSTITIYKTGTVVMAAEARELSFNDLGKLGPMLLIFIVYLLWHFFRNYVAVLVPLCVIFFTLIISYGIMGYLGFKFTMLTFITPITLVAICIADSIHFQAIFFQNIESGIEKEESLKKSLDKNFFPTFITSVTTAIGFLSLTTAELMPIADLGIISGSGALIAWVVSVLCVLPLLKILPTYKKNPNRFRIKTGLEGWGTERVVDLIDKKKNHIILTFVLIAISSLFYASQNEVNFNFFKNIGQDVQISQANNFLLKEIGGVGGPEIVLDSGIVDGIKEPSFLKKVDLFDSWLRENERVNNTASILPVLKQMNKTLNAGKEEFYKIADNKNLIAEQIFLYTLGLPAGTGINHLMTVDNRKLRMSLLWDIQDAKESKVQLIKIRAKAKELGLDIRITGIELLYQAINSRIITIFFKSMGLAIVMITIFLIIFMRSFKLGILSLVPNLIPLFIGGGALMALGIYIDSGVAVVCSVCLGIAVDDTIHFIGNYQRLTREGVDQKVAIAEVLKGTGNALIITTLILLASFGSFATADYIPNANFGIICVVVLSSALILDLIFLPAFILKFRRHFA